jgi:hypothetical protein
MSEHKDDLKKSFVLAASLFVKPVLFLAFPILIIRKELKTVLYATALFASCTVFFLYIPGTHYYFKNLIGWIQDYPKSVEIFSLTAPLIHMTALSVPHLLIMKICYLTLIVLLALDKRMNTFTLIFISVAGFLFWGNLVFEYHYTILIPFFVLGPLYFANWKSRIVKSLIVLNSLPSLYVFFNVFFYHSQNTAPNPDVWLWVNLSKNIPLLVLMCYLLYSEYFSKTVQQGENKRIGTAG